MKLKGRFIGADGSNGFRKGKVYDVQTFIKNGYLFIESTDKTTKPCPYSRAETLLENWDIAENKGEQEEEWADF